MHRNHLLPCILAASLAWGIGGVGAEPPASREPAASSENPEVTRLRQIFGNSLNRELFSDEFLTAVPLSRMESIVHQVEQQVGALIRVTGSSSPYTLIMEEGSVSVAVSLNAAEKVQGLRILQIEPAAESLEESLQALDQLPGRVSYLITRNGETLAARQPDQALAVGSSFKLAVLRALRDEIEANRLAWERVVRLKERWRSLPTGILQDWPAGTALTIESLAVLMISRSDNTATDALIDIIGRERVERYAPDSRPLLTTREAFLLKKPEAKALRSRYLQASEEERRSILGQLEGSLPAAELFAGDPVAPQIEWFMSTAQLVRLIRELSDMPLTSIQAGPVQSEKWKRVAYKGGSEPGIINMTLYLESTGGTHYCISVTQNREEQRIDETRFVTLLQGLIGGLQDDTTDQSPAAD
jgi:beta-lactamase class A